MYRLARRTASKVRHRVNAAMEKWRLADLYSPDHSDLDESRHIAAAVGWLKRAQDAGSDRGVSYGVRFGSDFQESYPETTGYICRTFVELSKSNNDEELFYRAVEMGDWEARIQLPSGAVMGGKLNLTPTPAIFNTGMVLLGWSALIRAGMGKQFIAPATRAADWMLSTQEPDGNWIRGNSSYALPGATVYNVKAAWGLGDLGAALGREDYLRSAIRNAEFCLRQQRPNGWFRNCCLSNPAEPLLHTVAYTMEGLIGIGELSGRREFIDAARTTADAQLRVLRPDGFLPGRQDADFRPAVDWCCLTGSAQTSIVMSKLHGLTGARKYADAAVLINRYLMAHHDIRNTDSRLHGGVPGSWPVWGAYGRFTILNWATKFLLDALRLQPDTEALSDERTGTSRPH